MKTYLKFGLLIVAILGTLLWLSIGGITDTSTYYKTISELNQMGTSGKEHRLRVGGDVADSIHREGREVRFTLTQDKDSDGKPLEKPLVLAVVYNGIEPLPDTFKGGAQALADGKMGSDGVFHATKIQAKCASKYEAKPIQAQPSSNAPRASL
jgi:cytochrome c-type biogenesis protein CcmE